MKNSTYVIAEAGSNFDGKLDQAMRLIDIAAEAGADAVKFQLFKADVLYPDKKQKVHDIVRKCELPREWIKDLNNYAKKCSIDFLVTPFDSEAIEILEDIDIPAYKWGSSETTNHRLLLQAARTKKPIYLSTGMCTMADIAEAIEILQDNGTELITVLHCISVYPTKYEDANLKAMLTLKNSFDIDTGLSDHSLDISLPIAATALGANVIEKHFTIDRSLKGPDHSYALEPDELKEMIRHIRNVEKGLGSSKVSMHSEEKEWGRREGIYAKNNLKKGHILTDEDLYNKRPAISIPKRYFKSIIGCVAQADIIEDEPIFWKDIA